MLLFGEKKNVYSVLCLENNKKKMYANAGVTLGVMQQLFFFFFLEVLGYSGVTTSHPQQMALVLRSF